jgi:hypothetical protein
MLYSCNKGPCAVCGRKKNEKSKERFRKLQIQTLAKAQASPKASLLAVKLQVGYELCQEHYNKLVCYDRNTKGSKKRNSIAKDIAYHGKNIQEKRVCLSQETNQQFTNVITVEQLELQIKELQKDLEKTRNNNNGNVEFNSSLKLIIL